MLPLLVRTAVAAFCLLACGVDAFSGIQTLGLAARGSSRSSQATGGLRMAVDSVEAKLTEKQKGGPYKPAYGPVITLFDNPGCPRVNNEYKGRKSGDLDDERCVMVRMEKIFWSEVRIREAEAGRHCSPPSALSHPAARSPPI